MRRIYIVGSINRDLVVYVDELPRPGETVFGNRFQQFPGGKGANQAVAASRLGGDVHFVGNVGSDAFGKEMRDFLAEENIDTSKIAILDTAPTGIALITVNSASENCIVVVSGANMVWHTRDLSPMRLNEVISLFVNSKSRWRLLNRSSSERNKSAPQRSSIPRRLNLARREYLRTWII